MCSWRRPNKPVVLGMTSDLHLPKRNKFLYSWGRPRKPVALGMAPDLYLPNRNEHFFAAGADLGSLWPWEWNQTCTTKAAELAPKVPDERGRTRPHQRRGWATPATRSPTIVSGKDGVGAHTPERTLEEKGVNNERGCWEHPFRPQ